MRKLQFLYLVTALLLAAGWATPPARAWDITSSVLATGLKRPAKIILTPAGNLLVSEGGDAPPSFVANQGRVSIVDRQGQRRTLLDNLPSGLDLDQVNPSGPSGLWLDGSCTLFVLIGQGDTIRRTPANQEAPNPDGLSSALFSSLWQVSFSDSIDEVSDVFTLDPAADYAALGDGSEIDLSNSSGQHASIKVLAQLRHLYPAKPANIVSGSNPYGLTLHGKHFFLPDAGQNSLVSIHAETGRSRTITHFPDVPNTAGFGPPTSQAVPASIRGFSRRFALVSLFSGFPFGPGAASVRLVNLHDGIQTPFITGLTMAIDALTLDSDSSPFLVLEFASSFVPPGPGRPAQFVPPGRLLLFVSETAPAEVLLDNLTSPSSMALDAQTNELFITEIFTGRIIRVGL